MSIMKYFNIFSVISYYKGKKGIICSARNFKHPFKIQDRLLL